MSLVGIAHILAFAAVQVLRFFKNIFFKMRIYFTYNKSLLHTCLHITAIGPVWWGQGECACMFLVCWEGRHNQVGIVLNVVFAAVVVLRFSRTIFLKWEFISPTTYSCTNKSNHQSPRPCFLVWISQPISSRLEKEGTSQLVLYLLLRFSKKFFF